MGRERGEQGGRWIWARQTQSSRGEGESRVGSKAVGGRGDGVGPDPKWQVRVSGVGPKVAVGEKQGQK